MAACLRGFRSRRFLLVVVLFFLPAGAAPADDCVPTPPGGDPRICEGTHSLVLAERYLLAVHAAEPGDSFADHQTYLLESDDGVAWSQVVGWEPYTGSVPEVTIVGGKLYLYNPGRFRVYDLESGTVSGNLVSIRDDAGEVVRYVDPSTFVDGAGRIVLFFLNSTDVPLGTDPASGTDPKDFDAAIEDAGSGGMAFTLEAGPRVQALGSDPDIFFDGSRYVLYISYGGNTRAYSSSTLHGSYEGFAGLGSEALLTGAGGVPAGHYDVGSERYWTYVHTSSAGATVVRRAVHEGFDHALDATQFATVVEAADLGLDPATHIESPSFFDRDPPTPVPGLSSGGLGGLAGLIAAVGLLGRVRRIPARSAPQEDPPPGSG